MTSTIERSVSYHPIFHTELNQEITDSDSNTITSIRSKSTTLINKSVENTFLTFIIINSIMMGIGTFDFITEDEDRNAVFYYCDLAFLCIFTIELGLTVVCRKYDVLTDTWVRFDFVIIGVSWILLINDSFDPLAKGSKGVQIIRSLRVFRIISRVNSMRDVFIALGQGLPKLGCLVVFTSIVMFIFGIFFTEQYKDMYEEEQTESDYFSRLDYTILTLFQLLTLDNWISVLREVMIIYPISWIPFLFYVSLTAFVIANVIIAIICESIFEMLQRRVKEKHISRDMKRIKKLLLVKLKCVDFCDQLGVIMPQSVAKAKASGNNLGAPQAQLNEYTDQVKLTGARKSIAKENESRNFTSIISASVTENACLLADEINGENISRNLIPSPSFSTDGNTLSSPNRMVEKSKRTNYASGTPSSIGKGTSTLSMDEHPTSSLDNKSFFSADDISISSNEIVRENKFVPETSSFIGESASSSIGKSASFFSVDGISFNSTDEITSSIDETEKESICRNCVSDEPSPIDEIPSISIHERDSRSNTLISPSAKARNLCGDVVNHRYVQRFVILVIFVNSILLAIGTLDFVAENPVINLRFDTVNSLFLGFYTVENAMQLIYHGPRDMFSDGWLTFDFILITLSWILSLSPAFRVLRVLRLAKVVPKLKAMRAITGTLYASIPKISAIAGILLVFFYVFAVMFTTLFKDIPFGVENGLSVDYFGRLDKTLLTLFQIMTMEDWAVISRELSEQFWWAHYLTSFFLIISGLLLINAIVALICQAFMVFESSKEDDSESHLEEQNFDKELLDIKAMHIDILNLLKTNNISLKLGAQYSTPPN